MFGHGIAEAQSGGVVGGRLAMGAHGGGSVAGERGVAQHRGSFSHGERVMRQLRRRGRRVPRLQRGQRPGVKCERAVDRQRPQHRVTGQLVAELHPA